MPEKYEESAPESLEQKASEQGMPDQKTSETKIPLEKSSQAVDLTGPSSAEGAKASSMDARSVDAQEQTGKVQHQKASDAEKEPTEKIGHQGPASASATQQGEEKLLATSVEPSLVQRDRAATSPPVKTAALEAAQSDNRAPSTAEAGPNGGRQPQSSKLRETVIQPERLPIKDDGWPDAAASTTFTCPETHTEHTGAISVDWASLQDFLLPEFAAVL